ncbi:MAG TPA: TlpA disulfide reductase family protein [Polyangia bacterium]|nr:TlpA disulfide reductase family protein [Polyangia bacterium]
MTNEPHKSTPAHPPAHLIVRVAAYGAAALIAGILIVLFARALPDAMARARDGEHAGRAAACEALQPTPMNAALGAMPVAAPDFALKDWQGREVRLSSLRGQVVLVNFWATWCNTCVIEMASMERLAQKERGKNFRLLAVSVDDDWAAVRKFFAKGTPLEVLLDPVRDVPKKWGTEQFPESFLIDKDGTIRYYIVSNRDWSAPTVSACIDAMLD